MVRRVSSPIFIGRVAERAALAEALDRAAAGQPHVVLIAGEAGVGKSRLLTEVSTLAAASGSTTVSGHCIDLAIGTFPYAPFVDVVRDLQHVGVTASLPLATRAELGRLVPELAAEGGSGSIPQLGDQGRLFAAVRDAIAAAAITEPLVVVLEDLHWADPSTLDLVTYLARSMGAERYVLVLTARLDETPRDHRLRATVSELDRLPGFERIELRRFDALEVTQQLTGILGSAPDRDVARDVFERSDGNPFFAEELIASGAAGGASLPASLRELLISRLATLGEPTRRVLGIAAVAGRTVDHELLERVAKEPAPVLIAALKDAISGRILVNVAEPVPGYAFRHALMREAAYDELLAVERTAVHLAIADTLDSDVRASGAADIRRAGEIAHHAMAAGDLARALVASRDAAEAAEAASAHADAEVHLDRMLELWPRVQDPATLVGLDLGAVQARAARAAAAAGHQIRAVTLARDALTTYEPNDIERWVATQLELFDYAWEAADVTTAESAVREALPVLRDERSERSARAFAAEALLQWHYGRYSTALEASAVAIDVARAVDAPRELVRALTVLGQVYTHLGETNRAEAVLADAGRLLDVVLDPDVRARLSRWSGWNRFCHGDFESGLAHHRHGFEIARRAGADGRHGAHQLDGVLENLVELGRWPEALATAEQIKARVFFSFEIVYSHMSLARLHTYMGRTEDADREIEQGALIPTVGPHRVWQLEDQIFLAYATGRPADGRRLMDTLIDAMPETEHDATLWWSLVKATGGEADHAASARRRRRRTEADEAVIAGRRFIELFRRSARRAIDADGSGPLVRAEVLRMDAEAERLEGRADPARWAVAVQARSELQQPWESASVRYRHAEAILASGGSVAEAAIPLREAHAVATDLGALPLQRAIQALASRARIRLDLAADATTAEASGGALLTTREREVLALVAVGHTNREIGDRLFISEKTASVHVTHAMDKLGALSRYDAAAAATRLGLLPPADS